MLAQNIAFGILAAAMVIAALRVVTTNNVVHAALYLVIVLGGAAGIYVLLAAEFVAIVQLLVYVGAIVVLFLFGTMLTRAPIGKTPDLDNDQRFTGFVVALFLLGVIATTLWDGFDDRKITFGDRALTGDVGNAIFSTYLVPFEVISVLLLAALIGAVVLARKD